MIRKNQENTIKKIKEIMIRKNQENTIKKIKKNMMTLTGIINLKTKMLMIKKDPIL